MSWISDKVKRLFFIVFGTFFLMIGFIGIIIPVLPTTPFLLLAAACYIRGSERLHHWLVNNRIFGEFIKNYMEGKGIKQRQKIFALIFLWLMIILSIFFIVDDSLLRIILLIIAITVSFHIIKLPKLAATY
jgi:uncharacterized membrane protein YbaN (DUF454 family)